LEEISNIEKLRDKLSLNQLQLNRLLELTFAINNNMKIDDLFKMYNSFLSWELKVKSMLFYFIDNEQWTCASSIGNITESDKVFFSTKFQFYKNSSQVKDNKDFAKHFDFIIPVFHKEHAIAYALIGGLENNEDEYSKIQFINTITNIIAVAIENKRLFKQQIEQKTLDREMVLARDMQLQLVPDSLPMNKSIDVNSIYHPHFAVGGDYFDCIALDIDRFLFVVADISGKGLSAALLMSNLQANIHAAVNIDSNIDLEILVHRLNKAILKVTKGEKYLTLFIAEYNTKSKLLKYINAGHIPPILFKNNQIYNLDKGTTIIGMFDILNNVEIETILLPENSLLLMFTDGITDIKNEQGIFYGQEYIEDFVLKNGHLDPQLLNEELMKVVEKFKGSENDYPDDITVLTCRFKG
jgi:phosphoserine phosphatase RsbU/P